MTTAQAQRYRRNRLLVGCCWLAYMVALDGFVINALGSEPLRAGGSAIILGITWGVCYMAFVVLRRWGRCIGDRHVAREAT